jgi:hypothetical protein
MHNHHPEKFADLEGCYGQLASWCDLLEAIAHFLPSHVDERLCDTITIGLVPLLQTTHRLEEQVISAGLHLVIGEGERAEAEEGRRCERIFDLDNGREVVEVLSALKDGGCRMSWGAVGYLLRSFFHSMRKHIKAEREIMGMIRKARGDNNPPGDRAVQAEAEAA